MKHIARHQEWVIKGGILNLFQMGSKRLSTEFSIIQRARNVGNVAACRRHRQPKAQQGVMWGFRTDIPTGPA